MPEITPLPTGVDLVIFHCPDCAQVVDVVSGLAHQGAPITVSAPAPQPCTTCRAKGH